MDFWGSVAILWWRRIHVPLGVRPATARVIQKTSPCSAAIRSSIRLRPRIGFANHITRLAGDDVDFDPSSKLLNWLAKRVGRINRKQMVPPFQARYLRENQAVTFDPFGDFETKGYLRKTLPAQKDRDIVRADGSTPAFLRDWHSMAPSADLATNAKDADLRRRPSRHRIKGYSMRSIRVGGRRPPETTRPEPSAISKGDVRFCRSTRNSAFG